MIALVILISPISFFAHHTEKSTNNIVENITDSAIHLDPIIWYTQYIDITCFTLRTRHIIKFSNGAGTWIHFTTGNYTQHHLIMHFTGYFRAHQLWAVWTLLFSICEAKSNCGKGKSLMTSGQPSGHLPRPSFSAWWPVMDSPLNLCAYIGSKVKAILRTWYRCLATVKYCSLICFFVWVWTMW